MSFILAKTQAHLGPHELSKRIQAQTQLQAMPSREFEWRSVKHYLTRTGIPVNFGITVILGFIVGAAIVGQTFYIFVLENIRQFGALKAIGVTNRQILRMVSLQALVVALIGYGIGIGLCALFFYVTKDAPALKGFRLHWEVALGTFGAVMLIILTSSMASIRRALTIDPAIVFRG